MATGSVSLRVMVSGDAVMPVENKMDDINKEASSPMRSTREDMTNQAEMKVLSSAYTS